MSTPTDYAKAYFNHLISLATAEEGLSGALAEVWSEVTTPDKWIELEQREKRLTAALVIAALMQSDPTVKQSVARCAAHLKAERAKVADPLGFLEAFYGAPKPKPVRTRRRAGGTPAPVAGMVLPGSGVAYDPKAPLEINKEAFLREESGIVPKSAKDAVLDSHEEPGSITEPQSAKDALSHGKNAEEVDPKSVEGVETPLITGLGSKEKTGSVPTANGHKSTASSVTLLASNASKVQSTHAGAKKDTSHKSEPTAAPSQT